MTASYENILHLARSGRLTCGRYPGADWTGIDLSGTDLSGLEGPRRVAGPAKFPWVSQMPQFGGGIVTGWFTPDWFELPENGGEGRTIDYPIRLQCTGYEEP